MLNEREMFDIFFTCFTYMDKALFGFYGEMNPSAIVNLPLSIYVVQLKWLLWETEVSLDPNKKKK